MGIKQLLKSTVAIVGGLLIVLVSGKTSALALANPYVAGSTGYDVSWPNCKAAPPMLPPWGVVGVTGGLNFRENPCLDAEANWFINHSLYVNTGYAGKAAAEKFALSPQHCDSQDETCLAYNFGYAAGAYAVQYAASKGVHASIWWLDVETENSWSDNTNINRASIQGTADAVKRYTVVGLVGAYSYPGQWGRITGGWRNGWPNWTASGGTTLNEAKVFCKDHDFTGGGTWLTQYTVTLDRDYVCGV